MAITKVKTDNLKITSRPYLEPELRLIRDKHTLATSVTNPLDTQDSAEYKRKQWDIDRHTHTHTREKHNDQNPLQGLPGTYISGCGMFIFKIKECNWLPSH